ncbi:MAG: nucleoside transporter C-terminal domain-containing protein [Planctomycetota bacterium]
MPLQLLSLLGILTILGLCFLLSRDRKSVRWRTILTALGIQFGLGLLLLGWDPGSEALFWFGGQVKDFLDLSKQGSEFVFGSLATNPALAVQGGEEGSSSYVQVGFIFATAVLPIIIFFSSVMSIAYHLGIMQRLVGVMAKVMARALGTSGAESMSACGNIFVGQTEAPLLVKPFLPTMTRSELHAVMTGGFATIAGSVFGLYVGFGIDPGLLVVASVMAVPAGIACSKLLEPETEQADTMGRVDVHIEKTASNVVEAAANGASDGLKLALNVAAMLVAFLGLVGVIDWIFEAGANGYWLILSGGDEMAPEGYAPTLESILGSILAPFAWLLGVPWAESEAVGSLLGKKLVVTELFAFKDLGEMQKANELSDRSIRIASFALCGFANVGSVAIQVGGLSSIAPDRKADLAGIGFRAMFAGALATCMTGALAGLLT